MPKLPKELLIYQAPNGAIQLKADVDHETIWANQAQIADIFGIERSVVTKHINNIFKDQEIDQKRNVQNLHIANSDKPVKFYSLDVILAVGYRTKSSIAIKFRQRATQTLKQHITQGFTINKTQIIYHHDKFLQVVEDIKKLSHNKNIPSEDVLELIKAFGQTWFSLDAFDKQTFNPSKQTAKKIKLEGKKLYDDILKLKQNLIQQNQTTDLFAQEKEPGSLEGILGNIFQSAFGKDVYPSIESKAAHLLYFIIKNHPFADGNKRSGAFAFVRFLQKVGYDFRAKITPEALTTMALLIATSDPKDKQRIIDLVILLLSTQ